MEQRRDERKETNAERLVKEAFINKIEGQVIDYDISLPTDRIKLKDLNRFSSYLYSERLLKDERGISEQTDILNLVTDVLVHYSLSDKKIYTLDSLLEAYDINTEIKLRELKLMSCLEILAKFEASIELVYDLIVAIFQQQKDIKDELSIVKQQEREEGVHFRTKKVEHRIYLFVTDGGRINLDNCSIFSKFMLNKILTVIFEWNKCLFDPFYFEIDDAISKQPFFADFTAFVRFSLELDYNPIEFFELYDKYIMVDMDDTYKYIVFCRKVNRFHVFSIQKYDSLASKKIRVDEIISNELIQSVYEQFMCSGSEFTLTFLTAKGITIDQLKEINGILSELENLCRNTYQEYLQFHTRIWQLVNPESLTINVNNQVRIDEETKKNLESLISHIMDRTFSSNIFDEKQRCMVNINKLIYHRLGDDTSLYEFYKQIVQFLYEINKDKINYLDFINKGKELFRKAPEGNTILKPLMKRIKRMEVIYDFMVSYDEEAKEISELSNIDKLYYKLQLKPVPMEKVS